MPVFGQSGDLPLVTENVFDKVGNIIETIDPAGSRIADPSAQALVKSGLFHSAQPPCTTSLRPSRRAAVRWMSSKAPGSLTGRLPNESTIGGSSQESSHSNTSRNG